MNNPEIFIPSEKLIFQVQNGIKIRPKSIKTIGRYAIRDIPNPRWGEMEKSYILFIENGNIRAVSEKVPYSADIAVLFRTNEGRLKVCRASAIIPIQGYCHYHLECGYTEHELVAYSYLNARSTQKCTKQGERCPLLNHNIELSCYSICYNASVKQFDVVSVVTNTITMDPNLSRYIRFETPFPTTHPNYSIDERKNSNINYFIASFTKYHKEFRKRRKEYPFQGTSYLSSTDDHFAITFFSSNNDHSFTFLKQKPANDTLVRSVEGIGGIQGELCGFILSYCCRNTTLKYSEMEITEGTLEFLRTSDFIISYDDDDENDIMRDEEDHDGPINFGDVQAAVEKAIRNKENIVGRGRYVDTHGTQHSFDYEVYNEIVVVCGFSKRYNLHPAVYVLRVGGNYIFPCWRFTKKRYANVPQLLPNAAAEYVN